MNAIYEAQYAIYESVIYAIYERATSQSFGTTFQKTGKELMSQDEIAVMDGRKCIVVVRGVRPFLSDKYDITKHKRYTRLSDHDKRNAFDVGRYLSTRLRIKQSDKVDTYDLGTIKE